MSTWTHVDGDVQGIAGDLSGEPTPTGSETGSPFRRYGEGNWAWTANLRDTGEEDAPGIRDWFAGVCERTSPRLATLQIDTGDGGRYDFVWVPERRVLELEVPPLYREWANQLGRDGDDRDR